ncbi:MAG: hypothetical protein PHZ09_09605 [Eubacteriales bacterium]|jgi:membrane protein DedA with SNARE-associated domain|nr:hypothetical protein [Eubacteriales bacterium]
MFGTISAYAYINIVGFIMCLTSLTGSAVTSADISDNNGLDILTVVILAVVLVALITVFIYRKKNRK